jgi:hypothetical protein
MGRRHIQADENQLPVSNYSPRKHRPPPCHPDRSAAQWRDLRCAPRTSQIAAADQTDGSGSPVTGGSGTLIRHKPSLFSVSIEKVLFCGNCRGFLKCQADKLQTRDLLEVLTVVRYQGNRVAKRASGDPKVVVRNNDPCFLQSCLEPPILPANLVIRRDDNNRLQPL